jgi:hypothetical protein
MAEPENWTLQCMAAGQDSKREKEREREREKKKERERERERWQRRTRFLSVSRTNQSFAVKKDLKNGRRSTNILLQ